MSAGAPVFVFSAGPRSGSTLLQRLVISSREVLMWGETGGALNHLLESLRLLDLSLKPGAQGGANGANQFKAFLDAKGEPSEWIANMHPPIKHIAATYVKMFDRLYGAPARSLGFARWGIKEVRGTAFTVRMLRGILPDAKFVFLVRHPLACLRSIKQRNYRFVDNWGRRVSSDQLLFFARNWAAMAATFSKIPDAMLLRYEDLTAPGYSADALCEHLEVSKLDMQVISGDKVDWKAVSPDERLTDGEVASVMPVIGEAMDLFDYH